NSLHELQADARTLTDGFQHHRGLPSPGPRSAGSVIDHRAGRGDARIDAALFSQDFVESDPAGFGITTRVGDAGGLKFTLDGAILAIGAVQREEYHVCIGGESPFARLWIQFDHFMTERAQRGTDRR